MCRMNQEKLLHKVIQLKRQLALVEDVLMNIETESDLYRECVQAGLSFETTEQLRIAGSDRGMKCNYE
mgnify:CR=1 FL=1